MQRALFDESSRRFTRRVLASALAAFATVMAGTVVFACTMIMGPLTLTPDSGPPGTVVTTSATGLKPYPARYDLFFGGTCMTFTGKLLKTITTDNSGGWVNVKVTVPKRSKLGVQALCGIELSPVMGQSATTHTSWTVT